MRPKIFWVFVAVLLVSCFGFNDEEARKKAVAEWKRHEASVERAISGPSVIEEFEESTMFFWKLTGIAIRGEGTPFGFLPNQYTAQDLEKVRDWCRRNCDRLYWDEKSHSVLVKD